MRTKFDNESIFRTTKCFGAETTSDCKGAFPRGFLKWVKEKGWWGQARAYLCSGGIDDQEAIKVDIRPEMKPTHLEDARKTSIPSNSCDWVMLDPPYSKQLAKDLYNTEDSYAGINAFLKEAVRITKPNGLICTLSYEIPKRLPDCDFVAVCGVYSIPATSYMRCFTVSRKHNYTTLIQQLNKQQKEEVSGIPPTDKSVGILPPIL